MVKILLLISIITIGNQAEVKSTKKAVLLSCLVPGLGETYMGDKKAGVRAMIIESTIWASYLGFNVYSHILRDDYILYGYANAGVRKGMNEDYYDAVEWYSNTEQYNTMIKEKARALFPNDRDRQLNYIRENEIPQSESWNWEDGRKWNIYRDLRKGERTALHNASYCIGAAIFNRVVSAIITTRIKKSQNFGIWIEPNRCQVCWRFR
jgi:hypothetical protein